MEKMGNFSLDPRLQAGSCGSIELKLCRLLLVNKASFPWVILVPKQDFLKEVIDLNKIDRQLLMEEISLVSEMLQKIFAPDKLNIATLGNIVPQLHIHIIARYTTDIAWPDPVFAFNSEAYTANTSEQIISQFKEYLDARK